MATPPRFRNPTDRTPMHLIVDAFNVLHSWGGGPEPGGYAELQSLSGLIARSRYADGKVSIVCDGGQFRATRPAFSAPCKVIFAGPGKDADGLIESIVRRDSAPRSLVVASSDRRLQRAVRKRGGRWVSSSQFLGQVVRDSAAPARLPIRPAFAQKTPLQADAVREWMNEFDISADFAGPGTGAEPPTPKPRPARNASAPATAPDPKPTPAPRSNPVGSDPLLKEALEHWQDRLSPADLDMARWLGEHGSESEDNLP